MTKRMAITLISVFVLIGLSAWIFIGKPFTQEPELKANDNPAISQSKQSGPDKNDEVKENIVVDDGKVASVEEVVKELKESGPDGEETTPQVKEESVVELEGFTKEEVTQAIQFGSDYARMALTNKYFIGGQFGDDGYKTESVQAFASMYYAKDLVDELENAEDKKGEEYINTIMPYVFYFNDNGIMSPHESCSLDSGPIDETTGLEELGERDQCFIKPVELSEITYSPIKDDKGDNAIRLDFDAEQTMRLTENETGKDASVDVKYKYKLVLSQTMDDDSNTSFEIITYDTSYTLDNVQYAEEK